MAITPQDIEKLAFTPSKHGYETEEVDAFLEQLSGELDAMLQKIADLKSRLTASNKELEAANTRVAELEAQLSAGGTGDVTPVADADSVAATEHQISQALIVAQQSSDRLIAEARENADKIRNEADQKAREVIRQALAEKQNELDEIERLKNSREAFREEYKSLLQHFMDDAESVMPAALITEQTASTEDRVADADATVLVSSEDLEVDDLEDID